MVLNTRNISQLFWVNIIAQAQQSSASLFYHFNYFIIFIQNNSELQKNKEGAHTQKKCERKPL